MNFTENDILNANAQTRPVAELVRAAQAGDRDAFGLLFERYRAGIVALAMRRVRNADEARGAAIDDDEHSVAGCVGSSIAWRSTA